MTYLSKKVMVTTNRLYLFSVRRKDISLKVIRHILINIYIKPFA